MAEELENKQEELQEQDPAQEQQSESPSVGKTPIETLLEDGEVTITAESREDIYRQADELVAQIPEGVEWTRPAVEYDGETGIFSQTYYIIKK